MLEHDARASVSVDARAYATHERTHGRTYAEDSSSDDNSRSATRTGGQSNSSLPLIETDELGAHLVAPTPAERATVTRRGPREPISSMVRKLVYRRDGWTCQRCGRRAFALKEDERTGALHLDHIVPWSAGGSDRSDNLRTLCGPCNESRSNFVASSDKASTPIVRICAPCLAAVNERITTMCDAVGETFTVYCGSRSHTSWAIPGWRIL